MPLLFSHWQCSDVADYVGITPQHFSKVFKEETGYNYIEWVSKLRIDMAKRYLSAGEKNIREICYIVGYKDPNYFSRIFKKIVGKTPTEYMKEQILFGYIYKVKWDRNNPIWPIVLFLKENTNNNY